ncbi:hypothetical protein DIPPA_22331 [Diplonema papillatum]|nr:hypothetical protein DIPPA_22331 [Diplonema papillatum]
MPIRKWTLRMCGDGFSVVNSLAPSSLIAEYREEDLLLVGGPEITYREEDLLLVGGSEVTLSHFIFSHTSTILTSNFHGILRYVQNQGTRGMPIPPNRSSQPKQRRASKKAKQPEKHNPPPPPPPLCTFLEANNKDAGRPLVRRPRRRACLLGLGDGAKVPAADAIRGTRAGHGRAGCRRSVRRAWPRRPGRRPRLRALGGVGEDSGVDGVVSYLMSACDVLQSFETISTVSRLSGNQVTVRCQRSSAAGFYKLSGVGTLVSVAFTTVEGAQARSRDWFLLAEAPGRPMYEWPHYGAAQPKPGVDLPGESWYPQPPVTGEDTVWQSPRADGVVVATQAVCREHGFESTVWDGPGCPFFEGLLGTEVQFRNTKRTLRDLQSTSSLGAVLFIVTASGVLITSPDPADGVAGTRVSAAESASSSIRAVAGQVLSGEHGGWGKPGATYTAGGDPGGSSFLTVPFPFPSNSSSAEPWYVTAALLPSPPVSSASVLFDHAANATVARARHLWDSVFRSLITSLDVLTSSLRESNPRGITAVTNLLRDHLLNQGSSPKAVSFAYAAGDRDFFLVAGAPANVSVVVKAHATGGEARAFSPAAGSLWWPDFGPVVRSDAAFDFLALPYLAPALPAGNPSLSASVSEPVERERVVGGGRVLHVTLPKCKARGAVTDFDTAACPRFDGATSAEVDVDELRTWIERAVEGWGDGIVLLLSPEGAVVSDGSDRAQQLEAAVGAATERRFDVTIDGVTGTADISDLGTTFTERGRTAKRVEGDWKVVVALFQGKDSPALQRLFVEQLASTAQDQLSSDVRLVRGSLLDDQLMIVQREASLDEVSARDSIFAAHALSCKHRPSERAFFSLGANGNFLRVECAERAGRVYSVQESPTAPTLSAFVLGTPPGVRGTGTYSWDNFGPFAHHDTWDPTGVVWLLDAAPEQNPQNLTKWYPQVLPQPEDPFAPAVSSSVVSATVATPLCLDDACASHIGFVALRLNLSAAETAAKQSPVLVSYVHENGYLLTASDGETTDPGTQARLLVASSPSALVRELAALRSENKTTGLVGGKLVWIDSKTLDPATANMSFSDGGWELVVATEQQNFATDQINALRGLLLESMAAFNRAFFRQAAATVRLVGTAFARAGLRASQRLQTDRVVAALWSACDGPLAGASFFHTSADGLTRAQVRCARTSTGHRRVDVQKGEAEHSYLLDEPPGRTWRWPNYAETSTTQRGNLTQTEWWAHAQPSANAGLTPVVSTPETGDEGYVLTAAWPRCGEAGVGGSAHASADCPFFAGIAGAGVPVTRLAASFLARLPLGARGFAFVFTAAGLLLASSDGTTSPDVTDPAFTTRAIAEAAVALRDRQIWGPAARPSERLPSRNRGYEIDVEGVESVIDLFELDPREYSDVQLVNTLYGCVVLRTDDFEVPSATKPAQNQYYEGGAAIAVAPLLLVLATLVSLL